MKFWSAYHLKTLLPALVLALALGVLLRYLLGGRSERVRMIPLQAVATLLLLFEILKQIRSLAVGYDLYHLPFHFCSALTLALTVMAFYRGKHKKAVRAVTTMLAASVFLLTAVAPALIYSPEAIRDTFKTFSDFHTTVFHTVAPVPFVLIIALDLHTPDTKRDMLAVPLFVAGFCAVSGTMAQLLKTNYHNFYTCSLDAAESVRLQMIASLGYGTGQLFYVLIFSAVNIAATILAYWFYRGVVLATTHLPVRARKESEDALIEGMAKRILKKHRKAFEELAK